MAVTIAQLLMAAAPTVIKLAGKNYYFTDVYDAPNLPAHYCYIVDPASGLQVPVTWHRNDEIRNTSDSDKIKLVKNLLQNAIDALTDYIEMQTNQSDNDYEDVIHEPSDN